jgi:hypothetical protein
VAPGQAEKLVALAPVVLLQMLCLHHNYSGSVLQWVRSCTRAGGGGHITWDRRCSCRLPRWSSDISAV